MLTVPSAPPSSLPVRPSPPLRQTVTSASLFYKHLSHGDGRRSLHKTGQHIVHYQARVKCACRLTETGQDRTGQDRTGQDRTGQDRTGQDRTDKKPWLVRPVKELWNTRVLDDDVRHVCDTCFWTQANSKAVWSRRLRNTQVSPCEWTVNCSVHACRLWKRDTDQGMSVKCSHVGETNNTPPHTSHEIGE